MILCHDWDQQECQDIIFCGIFLSEIWSTNTISVSVIVLQMRDTMLVIIELNCSLTFYHDRNLIPWVNNKIYIQKFYQMYKSNKYSQMIFTSYHLLCLHPNKLKFEPLHATHQLISHLMNLSDILSCTANWGSSTWLITCWLDDLFAHKWCTWVLKLENS